MIKNIVKPLTLSFIGGGLGSSIGKIHFLASQLDSNFKVVSGFFSRNIKKNFDSAKIFNIQNDRIYSNLTDLINYEVNKVDFFLVLAPTPDHFNILKKLIISNANIIIEKPIIANTKEAKKLKNLFKKYKKNIYVIHNYTGYPALREIKEIIFSNNFGKLLHFNFEMTQESFLRKQKKDQKVKNWRKKDYNIPNLFLDLGIHLFNLSVFIFNLYPKFILTDMSKFKNNNLVDNARVLLRYNNGSSGSYWISKSSLGNRNDLKIEIFFEKCSIKWEHSNFEFITLNYPDGTVKIIDRSSDSLIQNQTRYNRYRMGHPSGFIEAFANMYEDIAVDFVSKNKNNKYVFYQDHGLKGVKFLDNCIKSFNKKKWIINN